MILNLLQRVIRNEAGLGHYVEGRDFLLRSGVLSFLGEKSRPRLLEGGKDPVLLASHAAWCAGYAEALEDITYFKEKYVDTQEKEVNIRRDFGSLSASVQAGDLTEEEARLLRYGKSKP